MSTPPPASSSGTARDEEERLGEPYPTPPAFEIIDVDSLDDLEEPPQPPRQRRRIETEVIVLDDDSDGDGPGPSTMTSSRFAGRRQRSLPPPQPLRGLTPPVPALPAFLTNNIPMRSRPPPDPARRRVAGFASSRHTPSGVITAREGPTIPRLRAPTQQTRALSRVPTLPRPELHLGGGLIQQRRRGGAVQHRIIGGGDPFLHWLDSHEDNALRRRHFHDLFDIGYGDDGVPGWDLGAHFVLNALDAIPEAEYKDAYTHPEPAERGFVHDFAPPESPPAKLSTPSNPIFVDDDGSTTQAEEPAPTWMLVCSRCKDPLVLEYPSGTSASVIEKSKLWGLRCGHMLDAKCLNKLNHPQDEPVLSSVAKGKRKEVELPYPPPELSVQQPLEYRSRLRSFGRSFLQAGILGLVSPTLKRKRKGTIEAEYRWQCPVDGCGREHCSVKIDEVWKPEKARGEGAIEIFV